MHRLNFSRSCGLPSPQRVTSNFDGQARRPAPTRSNGGSRGFVKNLCKVNLRFVPRPARRFGHATRAQGEPPARVPLDKPFPRKGLSPLLRFFEKKYFAVCGRQRGVSPHTLPPLKRRAKLLLSKTNRTTCFMVVRFERIYKEFAQSKPTICPRHACDLPRVSRGACT